MKIPSDKLVKVCQEMADLTQPVCANVCRAPHQCCDEIYCLEAERYVKEIYGIELTRTDHERLPFMGPSGCTVPPHLRPICTVHACPIMSYGFFKESKMTRTYFKLRNKINKLLPSDVDIDTLVEEV